MGNFVFADGYKQNLNISVATVISVVFHTFLIFGITFTVGQAPDELAQDVATAMTENTKKNEHARFIASASQDADDMEEVQDVLNLQQQSRQKAYQESYLRTTLSIRYVDNQNKNESEKNQDDLEAQEERIRKKIRTLEAQLSQKQQDFASKSNVQTVSGNATTYGVAAAYLENFRLHVERIANQYYPEQARSQNITGDVRLMVIVGRDGHVKAITLLESSGSVMLDEAAKQSVRQSSPYGAFSEDMGKLEELRIIRTWRYGDDIEVTD